jgi:hypothetical protein
VTRNIGTDQEHKHTRYRKNVAFSKLDIFSPFVVAQGITCVSVKYTEAK